VRAHRTTSANAHRGRTCKPTCLALNPHSACLGFDIRLFRTVPPIMTLLLRGSFEGLAVEMRRTAHIPMLNSTVHYRASGPFSTLSYIGHLAARSGCSPGCTPGTVHAPCLLARALREPRDGAPLGPGSVQVGMCQCQWASKIDLPRLAVSAWAVWGREKGIRRQSKPR
jgi:hypothetical protein